MRFAFIGACLSAIGGIALVAGGIAPLTALTLAVCGGTVAFLSLRFLTRWDHAQSDTSVKDVPTRSSGFMHQPVCFIE
jgi:membrane protein implicated in regulation of membrane protease activity